MKGQHRLIRSLLVYKFEQGYKAAEEIKNICCVKEKDAIYHTTVTKWFKKFNLGCKNLDDQGRSDRFKNVDLEAVPSVTEANLTRNT